MDDTRDSQSNDQTSEEQPTGVSRRKFLATLGAATAAGAFLGRGGPAMAQNPVYWFYDSFGNVVPVAADAIAAGVYPPPLPEGVSPGGGAPSLPPSGPLTYVNNAYARPNILLIMVDQMRLPRWLTSSQRNAFNATIMPNVYGSTGSLRSTSIEYDNYFVAATACTPSRATLLTGLYAQQTCMFKTQEEGVIPPSLQPYSNGGFPTIGDVLSQLLPNQSGGGFTNYNTAWIGKLAPVGFRVQ